MWQLSFGNLWLCEAEKFFWSIAKANYPGEMKLNLNKEKIIIRVTVHKILVKIWFFFVPSSPILWQVGGKSAEWGRVVGGKLLYQPGTACRGLSGCLAPDLAHCDCPGPQHCLAKVPMGLQNLSHLAVSWGFVILPDGRGVGSRAGFRDRLFFLWKMGALLRSLWKIYCGCAVAVSSLCAKSVFTILTYALVFLFLPLTVINNLKALWAQWS